MIWFYLPYKLGHVGVGDEALVDEDGAVFDDFGVVAGKQAHFAAAAAFDFQYAPAVV